MAMVARSSLHILLAVSCFASGCGGDDDGGEGTTAPASTSTTMTTSTSSMSDPKGPRIEAFFPDLAQIDEMGVVTFTVMATDPDGLDTIVGGTIRTPDGLAVYGPLTQLSGGTFTLLLSWQQITQKSSIEFETEEVRTFQVEISDIDGHKATAETDVTLVCADGLSACGGTCLGTPLDESAAHCGQCGNVCAGPCSSGVCMDPEPGWTECGYAVSLLESGVVETCEDVCQIRGLTCSSVPGSMCGSDWYPSCDGSASTAECSGTPWAYESLCCCL